MTIRIAQSGDVPALLDLWQEMADLHRALDPRFDLIGDDGQAFQAYVRRALASTEARVLVAEESGRVAGFIIGLLRRPGSVPGRATSGHISDIGVTADHRNRGFGRALYQALEAWFRERGVRGITLNVAFANTPAQAFWRRLGFEDFTCRLWREVE